jgi:hypothetical protein
MKNLLIGLTLILTVQVSNAFERPFRVDRGFSTQKGFAIAWGIPGKNLDFEKLDSLSEGELEKNLDIDSVRNFIVDLQTNEILTIIENEDGYVTFTVGDLHYGNHYGLSLDQISVSNLSYGVEAIVVTAGYKWSSEVLKVLLVDTNEHKIKTVELDAAPMMNTLREKLKKSILPKNMDLFETGAENLYSIEQRPSPNDGYLNVITLDYAHPKQEDSLEVVATVKIKYENETLVPYILDVEQKNN